MIERIDRVALDDPGKPEIWFERESFPCPVCGRLLMLGGRKGWLLRRLRLHFSKCRPGHRVLRLRDWERIQRGGTA